MRLLLLGLSLVMVGLLAACSESRATVDQRPESAGITVTGTGEHETPPDTAYFEIGVEVTSSTVAEARDRAASSANALIASVKANGVEPRDIQTNAINVYPHYDYQQSPPVLTGYTVVNIVTVKVRNLETFSEILDDAVEAAGDYARLQSVRFGLDDDQEAKDEARKAAVEDARRKAEQLATLSGVRLGEPVSIIEVQQGTVPVFLSDPGYIRPPATGAGTPVETGTGKVVVEVSVQFAIESSEGERERSR